MVPGKLSSSESGALLNRCRTMALVPLLAATDSGVKLEGPCDGEESADSGANTVNGVG